MYQRSATGDFAWGIKVIENYTDEHLKHLIAAYNYSSVVNIY